MARYTSARAVPKVEEEEDEQLEEEEIPTPAVKKGAQEPNSITVEQVLDSFNARLESIESALFRLRNI